MWLSLLTVLAATALHETEGTQAILRELQISNRCSLPVVFHEAGKRVLEPGEVAIFRDGVDMSDARLSLSYKDIYINENLAILELNGMFNRIGQLTPKRNINFVAQWGFIDLPMQASLWADAARTMPACRDGRARCDYRARDCQGIEDASARFEEHEVSGETYGFCRSLFGTSDSRGCVGGYAAYVNEHCAIFDRVSGLWQTQAKSVGYSGKGWTEAKFMDGRTYASTSTGRENNGPAVTYECWEAPCVNQPAQCASLGHTSVGNSGFAIDCDEVGGVLDVAVLEVVACPGSGTDTAPAPQPASESTSSPAPTAEEMPAPTTPPELSQERITGLIRNLDGLCLRAGDQGSRGGNVQMWPCDPQSDEQQWQYEISSGQIKNSFGLCLATTAKDTNGGRVQMWDCEGLDHDQEWEVDAGLNRIKSKNGICLDAAQRNTVGAKVHMWSCNALNKNQQWSVGLPLPEASQLATSSVGLLRNPHGICLDAPEKSSNGGKVHMWQCNGHNRNQVWAFDPNSGQIKNVYGICLDSPQGSVNGGKVHVWACNTYNPNQKWQILPLQDTECGESEWPDRDHGLVCGKCKVLVDRFSSHYRTCTGYCQGIGRRCVGAWEEEADTCTAKHVMSCDQTLASSDAICECGAKSDQPGLGLIKNPDGLCLDAVERGSNGGYVHMWGCNAANKNQHWVLDASSPLALLFEPASPSLQGLSAVPSLHSPSPALYSNAVQHARRRRRTATLRQRNLGV